jgi:hypothetical protein
MPKDTPAEVKLSPPPETPTEIMRPTPNVIAAVEAFKKLSFVEFISFGTCLSLPLRFPRSSITLDLTSI